jgi:branched-chain amino acid transport system permease protein
MSDAAAQPDRPFIIVAPPALAAAALAVTALVSGTDGARVATVAGIYALLVIGYQFVFGRLGALSLGQSAFFGLGAYVTARLATAFDLPFLITFPAAILLPAAFAGVIATPVLRLKSHYFPLVTLGLAQLLLFGALSSGPIGGVPGVEIGGLPIPRGAALATLVWAVTVLAGLLAWRLSVTLFGRFAEIARDNPLAASAVGIDAGRLGVAAFMLSAGYAGAAGALCAHMSGEATPDAFGLPVMVACLSMAVVGGRHHVSGAIVGAILLVLLSEASGLGRYAPILWGVALLIAVMVAPQGIVGALQRRYAPVASLVPPAPQPVPPRKSIRVAGPLLAARGITRRFGGIVAVDNLSLALQPGEILGLIGPNGSGKTTLVNALSGLSSAQTGRVYLAGHDVTSIPPHAVARAGLARTFETAQLAESISVLDNVAAARAMAAGVDLRAILRRADADIAFARARAEAMTCIATVGLTAAAAAPAGSLSFADRRRLEVARALALNPLVVALDEPAAGLSAEDRAHLADLLRGLARRGLGLIVVEHDVAFLRGIATRLACLDAGRLIAIGTPEAVIADPKVVAAYLGGPAIGRGRVG